jgi:hypothetical protein
MFKRFAAVAAVVLAAFGPAGAAQDDPVNLSVSIPKLPNFKVRRPLLVLNGTAGLPDGVILKVNLSRMTEQAVGAELQAIPVGAGNGTSDVQGKKFVYDTAIDGPAKFNVTVSLVEDLQERHLAAEVKKKAGARRQWMFEYLVWGDDLVPTIAGRLPDLLALVEDCRQLINKFEKASATKAQWDVEMKPLSAEGNKFQAKIDNHELKAYFPAAVNNLCYTVRNVVNNSPYYTYGDDGKFSGAKDYHADNNKVKTFQGEEFNWANLKRYIENTPAMAGREFCLWVVKDMRRTAGTLRPEVKEAISRHKTAAGVDFFQERLVKATISDLDALETVIRGVKTAPPPPAPPDPKK